MKDFNININLNPMSGISYLFNKGASSVSDKVQNMIQGKVDDFKAVAKAYATPRNIALVSLCVIGLITGVAHPASRMPVLAFLRMASALTGLIVSFVTMGLGLTTSGIGLASNAANVGASTVINGVAGAATVASASVAVAKTVIDSTKSPAQSIFKDGLGSKLSQRAQVVPQQKLGETVLKSLDEIDHFPIAEAASKMPSPFFDLLKNNPGKLQPFAGAAQAAAQMPRMPIAALRNTSFAQPTQNMINSRSEDLDGIEEFVLGNRSSTSHPINLNLAQVDIPVVSVLRNSGAFAEVSQVATQMPSPFFKSLSENPESLQSFAGVAKAASLMPKLSETFAKATVAEIQAPESEGSSLVGVGLLAGCVVASVVYHQVQQANEEKREVAYSATPFGGFDEI